MQNYLLSFESIFDESLFQSADMFAAIDKAPAGHPLRVELLICKARFGERHVATIEETLKAYDLAQEAAAGDARLLDVVRSYRVLFLGGKAGRSDEALALAKLIELNHLSARERAGIERLQRLLSRH